MELVLNTLIKKNNIKSIIECIDFLFSIGYSLEENYNLSCEIFESKIQIDTKDLKDEELFFAECLNGCEITINKEKYPDFILYIKNGKIWFSQDLKNEWFWCSDNNIWSIFETKYQWNYQQIQAFIKNMLERHLGLVELTPITACGSANIWLERHLGLVELTPVSPQTLSRSCWKDILDF